MTLHLPPRVGIKIGDAPDLGPEFRLFLVEGIHDEGIHGELGVEGRSRTGFVPFARVAFPAFKIADEQAAVELVEAVHLAADIDAAAGEVESYRVSGPAAEFNGPELEVRPVVPLKFDQAQEIAKQALVLLAANAPGEKRIFLEEGVELEFDYGHGFLFPGAQIGVGPAARGEVGSVFAEEIFSDPVEQASVGAQIDLTGGRRRWRFFPAEDVLEEEPMGTAQKARYGRSSERGMRFESRQVGERPALGKKSILGTHPVGAVEEDELAHPGEVDGGGCG